MLFRNARLGAAAANSLKALLCGIEVASGGVPEHVWLDPYALGWISGYSLGAACIAFPRARHHLSDYDRGSIMHFAMRAVSPTGSETDIFQRVADFMKSDHPEFRKGFDAATKTCAYGAGGEVKPNDPDVLAAEHTTKLLVERGAYAEADRGTIAGMLTATLFYNVVLNHGSQDEPGFSGWQCRMCLDATQGSVADYLYR